MKNKKTLRRFKIKKRIRKRIFGTEDRPRLTVFRSNKQIYAQLIDDDNGHTLVAASSLDKSLNEEKVTKTELAAKVGSLVGNKAKEAGIEEVVFDRNGYLYHGRVKALADAARKAGLKF